MSSRIDDFFDNALELEESDYDEVAPEQEVFYDNNSRKSVESYDEYENESEPKAAAPSRKASARKPRVRRAGDKREPVFTRPSVFDDAPAAVAAAAAAEAVEAEAPLRSSKPRPKRFGNDQNNSPRLPKQPVVEDFDDFDENIEDSFDDFYNEFEDSNNQNFDESFDDSFNEDFDSGYNDNYDDSYDGNYDQGFDKDYNERYDNYDNYEESYDDYDDYDDDYEERPVKKKPIKGSKKKSEVLHGKDPEKEINNPKKSDNKKTKKIILIIIIIVAAGVLVFSAIKLIQIFSGYKKGSDSYKKIEQMAKGDKKDSSDPAEPEAPFSVDVRALMNENPDTKGYLYLKNVLSYPVVQGGDNSYYLDHLFDGTQNSCGCLFIDCNLPEGFESRNCIIYGHDMNDGSMFAQLHNYGDESYYKEHKEFEIFTEDHHYVYKVLSAFVTPVDGIIYTRDLSNDDNFVNFLNVVAGTCPYETEYPELNANSKVITMSTCLGNNDDAHRFVVVIIRDHEVFDEAPAEQTKAPEENQAQDLETDIPEEDQEDNEEA